MSTIEKWEVVGKKGTKSEKPIGKENKKKSEKLTKIQPKMEIEESKTMFGALLEAESKRDAILLQQLQTQPSKLSITSRPHLPIHHALNNADAEEIERLYSKQKQLYPSEKERWFRNIVNLFNNSFANINYDQAKFDRDFPLNCVSVQVEKLFIEIMSEYSDEYLKAVVFEFIELMYQAQLKDLTYVGYQVVIQIILKKKPGIVLKNLEQFEGLMHRNSKVPGRGLCILWTIGQAGKHNLKDALIIWSNLMFIYMTVKAYSSYVITFICQSLNNNWRLEDGFGIISKADYFKMFSEVFAKTPALPQTLHQQLTNIYPNIRTLAWGKKSENLHNYFIGYLNRCTSDGSVLKIQENLNCLVECLEQDVNSFDKWIEEFHKHIPQSRLLLVHLKRVGVKTIDASLLRPVLLYIVNKYSQPSDNQDLASCVDSAKTLLSQIGTGRSCSIFGVIRFFSIAFVISVLIFGILAHPQLNHVLKDHFGLSEQWLDVLVKIQTNIQNVNKWLLDRTAWIGELEWLNCAFGCGKEKFAAAKVSSLQALDWASRKLLIAGNFAAEGLLKLSEEGHRVICDLVHKAEPTLQYINQQMMAWLPVLLAGVVRLMDGLMHLIDQCSLAINHLVAVVTTWISHNAPFLSLKEILS